MQSRLIALLIGLLGRLPLSLVQRFGRALGWLLYRIPNREQLNARVNLALCFPDWSAEARERLLRETLRENATTLLEIPLAWRRGWDFWHQRLSVEPEVGALLREARAEGRGVILAAPHLGNWEVGLHYLTQVAPTTAFYRPPREPALEAFMLAGRARAGSKLAPIDARGIRLLLKALGAGEQVAILPDQQPRLDGSSGVFAPFFGIPALTMTLVSRMAAKSGAPVVLVYAARQADGGFLFCGRRAGNRVAAADLVDAAAALNAEIEQCVRRFPAQYQWTYRRFRTQPEGAANPYRRGSPPQDSGG
ncbi:MAG: lysophospholipid acyltransferase family protein [Gammaproteobacteria bacterium]